VCHNRELLAFLVGFATLLLLHPIPIHSLEELFGNTTRPDVILRIVLVGILMVSPILVACQSYKWRQCMVSRKIVIGLQTLICIAAPVFVAGIMCGYFPAVIVNYIVVIAFDATVAYIEFKIRIPVTERQEEEVFNDQILGSIFDRREIWMNPDITVAELACNIGTNRTYLSKLIKDLGYQSYSDMINRKRVEYICKELEKGTGYNITNLMFEAGFRSRSTASRVFKRITGCTPSEYLKSRAKN